MAAHRDKHIRALAGMRAFPPLILVAYHFCEGHSYRDLVWFDYLAAKGYLWVEFFFALSGFVLTHVYAPRISQFSSVGGYVEFIRARLARLYPLHLFMILMILVLITALTHVASLTGHGDAYAHAYKPVMTWPSFLANLALVQAWNIFPWLTWNGVSWFVSVEFFLCLVFPVFLWFARGRFWRGLVLIAVGIAGLVLLLRTSAHGLDITFDYGVARGLSDFSVGVGLAVLYRETRRRLPDSLLSAAQVLVLTALVWGIYFTGWSHSRNDIWTVLPMFALIYVLSFDRGLLASVFQWRPVQIMGEWSYAVYLGQGAWLVMIRFLEVYFPDNDAIYLGIRWGDFIWWGEPILLILACALWGWLLASTIEKPAARWLGPRRPPLDPEGTGLPSRA